jgi:cytochrome c556
MSMSMRIAAVPIGVLMLGTVAIADDDPIAQRRALMRSNDQVERVANSVILGKYFPDKAAAAMKKLQANMGAFPTLFPPGSESAGGTRAAPAIWSNFDDFKLLAAKLADAAKAAEDAAAKGQADFTLAWQAASTVCAACHVKYAPTMR